MLRKFIFFLIFVTASIFSNVSYAGGLIFEPTDTCEQLNAEMEYYSPGEIIYWASGYIAGKTSIPVSIHELSWNELQSELSRLCKESPKLSYVALIEKYIEIHKGDFGTKYQGKSMLMDFLADAKNSETDLPTFLLSLKPNTKDIRTIYAEPLASKLIPYYDELFNSISSLELKPEYTEIYYVFATTAKLRSGDAVLDEFPGGYKDVAQYLLGDYPLSRFKFVRTGETSGLAFDGLIFVNNHWVIMPKPWRALK